MLRLRVAENASDRVFVHAGVVGWNGRAVLIPATSFKGKPTLVAELIRSGAADYSDEYALLDSSGFVHPFPRNLSLRGLGRLPESSVPPEDLGGTVGREPVRVGAVLFTEYLEGAGARNTSGNDHRSRDNGNYPPYDPGACKYEKFARSIE